jgi:hypothetical protein
MGHSKRSVRHVIEPYVTLWRGTIKAKTIIPNRTRADPEREMILRDWVSRHSRKVNFALPGEHVRLLYVQLSWQEARVLAQLITGMAHLNGYLYQIRVASIDERLYGCAKETVEPFYFRWGGAT